MKRNGVHLVGVGGIGLSGLAGLLLARGGRVSGSDLGSGVILDGLHRRGATIFRGHASTHVPPDAGLVIHSAAIEPDNPELEEARRRRIRIASYTEVLGWMMRVRHGIAVAGTHGKTTTTAMIGHILVVAGLDPTVVIGGHAPTLGGNSRLGRGAPMVVEACEYRRSFLALRPRIAVMTNVEEDHLDYYRNLDEILAAFREFAELIPPEGAIVVNSRFQERLEPLPRRRRIVFGVGSSEVADVHALSVTSDGDCQRFRLENAGRDLGEVRLSVPGVHNVSNAAAAVAAALLCGVDARTAAAALSTFASVDRRFQVKGQRRGVTVIDDYAHHPTAVRAVLETARSSFPGRRLIAVFQPHQYSRTRCFIEAFARSFGAAERVIVPDIYQARDTEEDRRSVSSRDLVDRIRLEGVQAEYLPTFPEVLGYLESNLQAGDVCLTIGAGDVTRVSDELVRRLDEPAGGV